MPSPTPQLRLVSLRLPRYFTQEEVRRFLGVIRSPRDRALFALIYHHGLRVGEVALLTRGDVDLERRRILIRRSKRGAWSEQVLFGSTVQLLRRILDGGVDSATPLFPGRLGPLRKRRIQALFTRYRDAAELRHDLTCHSLRHAIATHLLDAGVSLEVIQDHLGHQSIRSTSIYARITSQRRAALFARLEGSPWIVQPESSTPPLPMSCPRAKGVRNEPPLHDACPGHARHHQLWEVQDIAHSATSPGQPQPAGHHLHGELGAGPVDNPADNA